LHNRKKTETAKGCASEKAHPLPPYSGGCGGGIGNLSGDGGFLTLLLAGQFAK